MNNIRLAIDTDFPALQRLYRQLQPADPVLDDGSDAAVFAAILRDDRLRIYLLEQEGAVVSTCYLNLIPNITRAARPFAVIENVVTDEAMRGRGLGNAVIQHALADAWSYGCYKVMLQTGSKRAETHRFYKNCGFSADDKQAFIAWRPGWKR